MASMQEVEWEACLIPPRKDPELEREIRKTWGIVPPVTRFLSHSPWVARSFARGNFHHGKLVHIPIRLADVVYLAVSQDNSCRYCFAAQRALLRIQGFDKERIARIEQAFVSAEDDPRESLVLDYARKISQSNPPPTAADRVALRQAGYSDEAITEIAYVATFTVGANRLGTLPALPVDDVEGFEDRWHVRLLRPLIARMQHSKEQQGQPDSLPPELKTGPFAYVDLEFDGLPLARVSRETMEAAWSSSVLSQRAKGLVFAVVARGLDSKRSEQEARRLLAPLGLDDGDVDEILSHLASPKLDPIEAAIVPFARETIRYRPADIQRRARKLLEQLSVEQFMEFVGVVGLANGICRRSLALCEN